MASTPVASAAAVVERGVVAGEAGAAAREPARHEAWPRAAKLYARMCATLYIPFVIPHAHKPTGEPVK